MRQVQLTATQSVRDRYVARVMQSFSLLILYRNNDNPKANCYVAGWQQELMYNKSMGCIMFLNISSDVFGFLIFHHNYSIHLFV